MGVWFFHKHSTLSLKVSRNTRGRPGLAGRGQVGSPGQHPPSSGLESRQHPPQPLGTLQLPAMPFGPACVGCFGGPTCLGAGLGVGAASQRSWGCPCLWDTE